MVIDMVVVFIMTMEHSRQRMVSKGWKWPGEDTCHTALQSNPKSK
jgi:transposase